MSWKHRLCNWLIPEKVEPTSTQLIVDMVCALLKEEEGWKFDNGMYLKNEKYKTKLYIGYTDKDHINYVQLDAPGVRLSFDDLKKIDSRTGKSFAFAINTARKNSEAVATGQLESFLRHINSVRERNEK